METKLNNSVESFLKLYPTSILIKQYLSQGAYFDAKEFDKYIDTQLGLDINEVEILEYKSYYEILFWDINEVQITSLSVPKQFYSLENNS